MKITRKRAGWAALVAIVLTAVALVLSACSNQLNDLNGIGQTQPNYAVTVLNVNGFPNFTMLCYRGLGFLTTTRQFNAIQRVPEWDAFCATKVGQTADNPQVPAPSSS